MMTRQHILPAVLAAWASSACGGNGSGEGDGSTDGTSNGSSVDGSGEGLAPPSIDAITPLEGPYGMVVTLEGALLAGDAALPGRLATLEAGAMTRCCIEQDDPAVVSWSDTQIELRWPFPLTGMPVIQTGGGLASAAEIVPWWTPGPEVAIPADVVGYPHFAPGPQALVLLWLENKIVHRIVVTDAGSVENHALLGDGELLAVSFVDHADEVDIYVVASAYDQYTVYTAHISPSGSWLDKVAESGTVGDALIAGGVDGAGRVAWVRDLDGALVRYRELGAAQWEIDRGPIAVPNPSGTAHQASVDPSGTLRLTWAEGSTPMLATLPADVDVFEASEVAADAAPVELVRSRSQTNAAGITLATWCGAGLSWVDPTRCVTRVRADDGTWSAPPTFEGAEPNSSVAYALDGPELLAAHCNDEGLHVTADLGSAPSEIAVWPCDPSDPTGFLARDGNGRINALVKDSSGESWFARQR